MLKPTTTLPIHIHSIELRNVRGFAKLRLPVAEGARLASPVAIVGRNGTCKSTLLRAIALGLATHRDAAAALLSEVPGSLVRIGAKGPAEVTVTFGSVPTGRGRSAKSQVLGESRLVLEAGSSGDEVVSFERTIDPDADPALAGAEFFACAYGPGRAVPGSGSSPKGRYRSLSTLRPMFRDNAPLQDPELVLRRLKDHVGTQRYEAAMRGLKRVLNLKRSQGVEVAKRGGVVVTGPGLGDGIPFDSWADGYKVTMRWLLDLYGWAMQAEAIDEQGNVCGVLLVDEVEQHLHPSMQADVLPQLQRGFPKLQVISTTHSPLAALGAGEGGLVPLHLRRGRIVAESVPSLDGFSAEDVLTDPALFGTDPYTKSTRQEISEYRNLLQTKKRGTKQKERMRHLALKLDAATFPEVTSQDVGERREKMRKLLEEKMARKGG